MILLVEFSVSRIDGVDRWIWRKDNGRWRWIWVIGTLNFEV